jgi:hypothetical protein
MVCSWRLLSLNSLWYLTMYFILLLVGIQLVCKLDCLWISLQRTSGHKPLSEHVLDTYWRWIEVLGHKLSRFSGSVEMASFPVWFVDSHYILRFIVLFITCTEIFFSCNLSSISYKWSLYKLKFLTLICFNLFFSSFG